MNYPKKVVGEVGGFDEDFQAWGAEDAEMAYRIYNAGYYFIPVIKAIGLHQEASNTESQINLRSEGRKITKDLLTQKCPAPMFRKYQASVIYEIPKVSIYMITYNAEKYIKTAINSVLAQTYTDFEICIVNNGSTDSTLQILEQNYIDNPRVHWKNQPNEDIAKAYNMAVKMCQGMYIGQLNVHDLLKQNAVEIMVNYLDNHNVGCVYSDYEKIDNIGNKYNCSCSNVFTRTKLLKENIISSFKMFRKRDWHRTSGSNERLELKSAVDYDIILKLSEICTIYCIRQLLCSNYLCSIEQQKGKYCIEHLEVRRSALQRQSLDRNWGVYISSLDSLQTAEFIKIK